MSPEARQPPRVFDERSRSFTPLERPLLALVLIAQAGLAVWSSLSKGLILDEFHTLSHARADTLRGFFEHARIDNHPPLVFALVAAARWLCGESELALRLPAILCALATTWLIARIALRSGAPPVFSAALWGLGSSPLEFASQVRMYAPLALCVAGALEALLRYLDAQTKRSRSAAGLAVTTWTALGLHAHYFFLHYACVVGLTLFALAARRPPLRRALLSLIPWLAASAAIALPWYLWGFRYQIRSGLPPGSVRASTADLLESYVHLLFWNVRVAGSGPRLFFLACGAASLLLAGIGFLRWARASPDQRATAWLLLAASIGVPLWANLLVRIHSRFGFNWGYVLPSATALAVLVAAGGATRGLGKAAAATILTGTAGLSVLNARAGGTEDYRGAVFSIVDQARASDCVLAVDWIVGVFGRWLAWDYYAPARAAQGSLPGRLEVTPDYDLADPEQVPLCPRVFVLRRSIHDDLPLFRRLRSAYAGERVTEHGYGVWVHVFEASQTAGDE